ncbi:hypothetical protein QOV31_004702 (plasmid) [Agrobacterium fabrum]|jgi:hypothetical protein|nr:hypothetical protein QOV31_004702 [Agrobacterium fabrum]CAD0216796.1 hypothetical protein AGTUEHA105_LOCUS4725 [Agrobacterium tumefaciens]SDB70723.1 hypothetical protein SAMN03159422_03864 [Agrobacterium fabrum]SES15422.1 hypothetical protein SAMN03159504_04859 [Agrobacterium fabrum]
MSKVVFVHCLFLRRRRVKHRWVEEYYPNISKTEDSKRIQGCRDNKNFYRTPLVSNSDRG